MPHAIRLLPDALVNRIAAGEVIERPAAALRELVENALDAGAGRIAVELAGGGVERIEVVDDGHGMAPADLALAVQRHCTSKLRDEAGSDILVRIATLGFRGEALPSIGAAARLSLTSRTADAPHASRISVEGGVVSEVSPASGQPGTRVVVADLFYATPARRKFLKQPRTEAEHAVAALRRLALAAPQVAFRCEVDGRVEFDLPPQDPATRAGALLGPEAAAALLPVAGEREGSRVEGFACAPLVSRATPAAQGLAVNGRPVTDPVLRTAVRVAFREVIAHGRHAVVALSLHVPADELDVNVHPAKSELRFRHPDRVRGLVISALTEALAGGAGLVAPRPALRLVSTRPTRTVWAPPRGGGWAEPGGLAEQQLALGTGPAARAFAAPVPATTAVARSGLADAALADPDPAGLGFADPASRPAAIPAFPLGAAVAQVLDTYVLAVAGDGSLVLVDQHAAHERLTHEALRTQLLEGGVRAQPLLLPAVVELPPAQAALLLAAAGALATLGLELEPFGPGAVLVRALPAPLGAPDPGPLLRDLAEELADCGEATALAARLDAVIARLACHGSIRAGRRLGQAEMDALLRAMEATPRAATCPHGRPTFLKLSRAEIERLFGRR